MLPAYIDAESLIRHIRFSLDEDQGSGDVTSLATIGEEVTASAVFTAKAEGIIAGCRLANIVFDIVDPSLKCTWRIQDGDSVRAGQELGAVSGNARSLLLAERLVLNYMQRMSGIATATRRMVDAVAGTDCEILDTRKTVPGLRGLDKWAVELGGGVNHRFGLYDMILIKDNHIAAAGGVDEALRQADAFRASGRTDLKIEIEAKTLSQVREIVRIGISDIIMLDNMAVQAPDGKTDTSKLEAALELIGSAAKTEASGNVTLQTVADIARTGVNAISSGALTHSVIALDISLNVEIDARI